MKISKPTTNVYDEIEARKAQRKTDIADAKEELKEAEAKKLEAEEDAKAALAAGDREAYKAAKNAERDASDDIEFLKHNIEALKRNPYFDDAEKIVFKSRVSESVGKIKADKLPTLNKLLTDAADIVEEVRQELAREAKAKDLIDNVGVSLSNFVEVQEVNAMSQSVERLLKSKLLARYK